MAGLRAAGAALAAAGGLGGILAPVTLWGARVSAGAAWQGYVLLGMRWRRRVGWRAFWHRLLCRVPGLALVQLGRGYVLLVLRWQRWLG